MSTSLYYKPVLPQKYKCLPDSIKYVLKERYNLEDGASILDSKDLDYLRGVRDAMHSEDKLNMDRLISAINRYEKVEIWVG